MTDGSYNPADVYGGTWEQIKGKYLMASGTYCGVTLKAMTVVGEEYHQISYAEMPAHGHTRGNMEITGAFTALLHEESNIKASGAFTYDYQNIGEGGDRNGARETPIYRFNASRSWTGTTSVEGKNQPMPMQPRAIVVDVWRKR